MHLDLRWGQHGQLVVLFDRLKCLSGIRVPPLQTSVPLSKNLGRIRRNKLAIMPRAHMLSLVDSVKFLLDFLKFDTVTVTLVVICLSQFIRDIIES